MILGIKKTTLGIGLGILLSFFLVYSFLPLTAPLRFNSPDEMSNHFFSTFFADQNRLWKFEPKSFFGGDVVHPRSTKIVDYLIVPGGFIGLPVIFGGLAKIFGTGVVPFLTPLFAVLAALAWGAIIKKYFGRTIGILAGLLLLVQPAWWYSASRTLMPNILLVALVIGAAYFFLVTPIKVALEKKNAERRVQQTVG